MGRRWTDKQKNELVGKRFGALVVESLMASSDSKATRYVCRCDCGATVETILAHLNQGKTRSCGCQSHLQNKEFGVPAVDKYSKGKYNKTEASVRELYSTYRSRCKRKDREWKITYDEFRNLIFGNCSYCGVPPSNQHRTKCHEGTTAYNGLDRIDSSLGYIDGNVVTACSRCNLAKRNMGILEFLSWVDNVHHWTKTHDVQINKVSKLTQSPDCGGSVSAIGGAWVG